MMMLSTSPWKFFRLALCSLTVLAGPLAAAQDAELEAAPAELRLTPGVWLPRLKGHTRLDGGPLAVDISFENQLSLNDQEATFNAELAILKDETWQLHFSGFDFSTSSRGDFVGVADFGGLRLSPGDPFRSELDLTSVTGEIGWTVLNPYPDADGAGLRLTPLFGVRYVDIDHELEEIGVGTERAGGEWTGVLGGLQLDIHYDVDQRLPLLERLEVSAALAAGPAFGGDGGIMWQVRASLTAYVTDQFGFLFGFRLVELDVENNGYTFDAGLQGLFLAGTIRF